MHVMDAYIFLHILYAICNTYQSQLSMHKLLIVIYVGERNLDACIVEGTHEHGSGYVNVFVREWKRLSLAMFPGSLPCPHKCVCIFDL